MRSYDPTVTTVATPWMVENLWMHGKINGMFGAEKSGKSRVLGWVMASILTNQSHVLSSAIHARPRKWLYLAGEETFEIVVHRLREYNKLLGGSGSEILPIDFIEAAGMRLDVASERAALHSRLVNDGYDCLVIEPMRRVHGGDEDSNTAMAPFNNDLRAWSNTDGITVVLVHHTGKLNEQADPNRIASWSRGASDLAAILDCATFLEERSRIVGVRRLKLLRAGRFAPVDPLFLDDLGDSRGFATTVL